MKVPNDLGIYVTCRNELIANTFPNLRDNYNNYDWLIERAILAAKNVDVDAIIIQIQDILHTDTFSFKSVDTVIDENDSVNYPTGFLNSLDLPGLPPHTLRLKIGSRIILLRNLNAPH